MKDVLELGNGQLAGATAFACERQRASERAAAG
jgi:hypothetical protein